MHERLRMFTDMNSYAQRMHPSAQNYDVRDTLTRKNSRGTDIGYGKKSDFTKEIRDFPGHPRPPDRRGIGQRRRPFGRVEHHLDVAVDHRSTESAWCRPFFEYLVFGSHVIDHFLLPALDPACEDDEVELPRLKYIIHDRSIGVSYLEMAFTIQCSIR